MMTSTAGRENYDLLFVLARKNMLKISFC